ncbi:AAA family ATPase [Novosphingobium sp. G106]|uniref:AAA family ATPase n=1 Tax=Novosphingobium sp. G106 TaxID=2849500 RepID=UPI001C2DD812|nr:AAA family ATPase [Novosphingobium sp. G106]MBV1692069.1 AAA family ATPase [Novosphingobium sp. G106]
MRDAEFKRWMLAQGYAEHSVNSDIARLKRVEAAMPDFGLPDADLDTEFNRDQLAAIIRALEEVLTDLPSGKRPPLALVPRSENFEERLRKAIRSTQQYGEFCREIGAAPLSVADRIRHYALDHYVVPARRRSLDEVRIPASDVNRDLKLDGHFRNIYQALTGAKFLQLARLPEPATTGTPESSTAILIFRLSEDDNWAELELRRRCGDPISQTQKIIGFALSDQRQIALDREAKRAQIWLEGGLAPANTIARRYAPTEARHSNLPSRLKHIPPEGTPPQPVSRIVVQDPQQLAALLDWYERARSMLDRAALDRLRARFLELHPEFRNFEESGSFANAQSSYKRALTAKASELMLQHVDATDAIIGGALLDLLSGRGGLPSNLLDWRIAKLVADVRATHPNRLETAAGKLVRAREGVTAIGAFTEETWPLISQHGFQANPYAESRTIPTMLRALVDPDMLGIRSKPIENASKMLLHRSTFGAQPLTRDELEGVLALAREIDKVMRDEWHWAPRDLWDVQGFLWETCQSRLTAEAIETSEPTEEPRMPAPTNLILYGPPGTGKTFATAREAVRLCDEAVPDSRAELMALYRALQQKGRIGFVTFHQNFSYEDFIEGLRPVSGTSEPDAPSEAGFSLEPQDGIFKQIAELAASNRGKALDTQAHVIDRDRKIFKMSLGRSRNAADDAIYQDAIRDGYVVLGWGGDVDWSDPRFEQWEAIKERWRQDHPEATGNDPNMSQMYTFRIAMQAGSLVVISDGNRRFRAIGEIAGPYQFVPGRNGEYNHRRKVRWLWHSEESLPRELIYAKELSQVSAYQLNSGNVNWEGLEQIVASGGDAGATSGTPEPYVLIIDEINRANISKVFGELITLIEPDKRVGMDNALTLTLPYSKKSFGVPANLHIVGTMNTADRSIALLDTALRRRFTFREIAPQPELLTSVEGIDLASALRAINDRVEYLIDREHRIGHAFFMGCDSAEAVDEAMREKVIPLLQEYFFEDWSRIHAVLGDGFIGLRKLKAPPGFDGDDRESWFVKNSFGPGAYQQLLKGAPASEAPAANDEDEPDTDADAAE